VGQDLWCAQSHSHLESPGARRTIRLGLKRPTPPGTDNATQPMSRFGVPASRTSPSNRQLRVDLNFRGRGNEEPGAMFAPGSSLIHLARTGRGSGSAVGVSPDDPARVGPDERAGGKREDDRHDRRDWPEIEQPRDEGAEIPAGERPKDSGEGSLLHAAKFVMTPPCGSMVKWYRHLRRSDGVATAHASKVGCKVSPAGSPVLPSSLSGPSGYP
jgi:hypothetical protein